MREAKDGIDRPTLQQSLIESNSSFRKKAVGLTLVTPLRV